MTLFAIVFHGGSEYCTESLVQWGSELQVGLVEGVNLSYFEVSVKRNNIVFCIKRDLIITPKLSTLNWFLIVFSADLVFKEELNLILEISDF